MKRNLTTPIFVLILCVLLAVCVCADGEVDHIFNAERIMQFDDGTRFENGFVNGGIINPGLGKYSTYQGIKFERTEHLGEDAIKVELLDGRYTGYFDFNYYQWDADAKKPALDASRYSYIKIRYAYGDGCENITTMKFLASKEIVLGRTIGSAEKTFGIVRNDDVWSEAVVRIDGLVFGDGTLWLESTIRQYRVYMFEGNTNPNAVCYISGIGFFETKDEAVAYEFTSSGENSDSVDGLNRILTELIAANPFVVGIIFGCIIGVVISIIVVAVVVNVSFKKRY